MKPARLFVYFPPPSITVSGKSFLKSLSSGPEDGISQSLCPHINHRSCHSQSGPLLSAWLQSLPFCWLPAVRGRASPLPLLQLLHKACSCSPARAARGGVPPQRCSEMIIPEGKRETQWQSSYMFWNLHVSVMQSDAVGELDVEMVA